MCMNESSEELIARRKPLRKRLGAPLFWTGCIIFVLSIIPNMIFGIIIGLVLAISGLLAAIFGEGHREDWNWIMKLSPFPGSN